MIEHHLQKDILDKLVKVPSARFGELKPESIDGNIFTYHLHQLIKYKYVDKQADGSYCLTATGKAAGINNKLHRDEILQQAHSVLLLMARDSEGKWLLRRRLVHPMYGKIGFIHTEPLSGEPINTTAARVLQTKSGLIADFKPAGSGYIRIFQDDVVESFTHFTLLVGEMTGGSFIAADSTGENAWYTLPDFEDTSFIPSMKDISGLVNTGELFFAELEYHL